MASLPFVKSIKVLSPAVWRWFSILAGVWTIVCSGQVTTNLLNDGLTTDGLTRLQSRFGAGGQEILLFPEGTAGGLVAEQTDGFTDFALHATWYVPSVRVVGPAYTVSAEARPAGEYPETRVGVLGWLDPVGGKGIALRVRPNPVDNRFEISVVDFAAATDFESDSMTGLFNLDGSPADAQPGSGQAEGGAYSAAAFATFVLEFNPPSPADLAALPEATARVRGRVFQADGSAEVAQVGGTIELLTTLPVPVQHQVGYYANWNSNLVPGATIGTVRMLTITGVIEQVNQRPLVALTSPAAGATSREPGSFQLAATASDPDGTIVRVDFLLNGQIVGSVVGGPPYQFTVANLPAGDYQLAARATDNLGATTTSEAVSVRVLPNQPPTVAITSPANGAQFVAPASFALMATASDPDDAVVSVEFFQGEVSLGTDTQAPYQVTVTDLPVGTHVFTAKATDARGATGTSAPISVQVRANQPPLVSVTSPTAGAEFIAPAEFDFIAQASDLDGTVVRVEFFAGETLLGTVTQAPFVFRVTNLAAGAYRLTARASDNRGASAVSEPVNILVRPNQRPTVTISQPPDGAKFDAPASFTLAANATDADGQVAKVEFRQDGVVIATVAAPPYETAVAGLGAGRYVFEAVATDDRGASSEVASVAVEVVSAVVQPRLTHLTPLPSVENFQQLQVTIEGKPGATYVVERSSDLVTWNPVETVTLQTTTLVRTYPREAAARLVVLRLREGSVPSSPPTLTGPQALPSPDNFQQFRFTAGGLSGRRYKVESSADLRSWTEVATGTVTTDTVTFTYPKSASSVSLFYRVAILP